MYQKKVTTTGSELRVKFGFVPEYVEVLNLTTNRKLIWSSEFPNAVTKLVTEAGVMSNAGGSKIAPIPSTGINDVSAGGLGIIIPTDATDDVNNTASQSLVIQAFRNFNK